MIIFKLTNNNNQILSFSLVNKMLFYEKETVKQLATQENIELLFNLIFMSSNSKYLHQILNIEDGNIDIEYSTFGLVYVFKNLYKNALDKTFNMHIDWVWETTFNQITNSLFIHSYGDIVLKNKPIVSIASIQIGTEIDILLCYPHKILCRYVKNDLINHTHLYTDYDSTIIYNLINTKRLTNNIFKNTSLAYFNKYITDEYLQWSVHVMTTNAHNTEDNLKILQHSYDELNFLIEKNPYIDTTMISDLMELLRVQNNR